MRVYVFVQWRCHAPVIWKTLQPCEFGCRLCTMNPQIVSDSRFEGLSQVEMLKGLHEIIVRKDPALLPVRAPSARDIITNDCRSPRFDHLGRTANNIL